MSESEPTTPSDVQAAPDSEYRVLARKYRPSIFREMIGQDVMVRVLTNAVKSGRLAHAFMMTGVRGVGKTTTARIIARGLNCIGPDGDPDFGPTTEPCGVCEHCVAIGEDRHVDVMEMDAASRTGVDDIRELIEGVRYRPTSARYKIYIIDEVHMLSKNAFNALLKTLEEPPEHVKFIFATTEIRKIPVTVLSRCQRFDLRRVEVDVLAKHFAGIAEKEGAQVSETALHLIAQAADGSVRDGLSLLDQAISHTDHEIGEDDIREMLGLADRSQSFDVFDALMAGNAAEALEIFNQQYISGADPAQVIEDLLDVTHWITRIKVSPKVADDLSVPEIERTRGVGIADRLGMAAASRAWQLLLKGLSEVRAAPSAVQAAEMVLIRLAHASNLPTPEEAIKALANSTNDTTSAAPSTPNPSGTSGGGSSASMASTAAVSSQMVGNAGGQGTSAALSLVTNDVPDQRYSQALEEQVVADKAAGLFTCLQDVADAAGERREVQLQGFIINHVRIVKFAQGQVELNGGEFVDGAMVQNFRQFLNNETGDNWIVSISSIPGAPSLAEQAENLKKQAMVDAAEIPLVKSVVEIFPGAKLQTVELHKQTQPDNSTENQDEPSDDV